MDKNTQPHRYHAFISYRHADNKEQGRQWATWLHQAIETYEVPKDLVGKKNGRGETIPARIYPVFRDEQELPAHADLGTSIVSALAQTKLLIVLCSPRAVSSTYVADEIDYFKKLGGSDRIIAAMIDGEPNASWDEGKRTLGFNKEDECFPQPLQFEYDDAGNATEKRAEPIAADFRINNDGKPEQGFTTPAAYREHLKAQTKLSKKDIDKQVSAYQSQLHLMQLKIIAGILGVPLGDLTQRDKEYQLEQARLKAKKLKQWLAVVLLLTIAAIGASIFAYFQKEEAVIQQQRAISERNSALVLQSQFLAEMAKQESKKENYDIALLLSLNAIPGRYGADRPYVDGIELSFHEPMKKITRLMNINTSHPLSRDSVKFDNNGEMVAVIDFKKLTIWSLTKGKIVTQIQVDDSRIFDAGFSFDGKYIFTRTNKVEVWTVATGKRVQQFNYNNAQLGFASFHPSKHNIAITSVSSSKVISDATWHDKPTSHIDIYNVESAAKTNEISIDDVVILRPIFNEDGNQLLTVAVDHGTYVWSLVTNELLSKKFINNFNDINTKPNRGTLKAGFIQQGNKVFSEVQGDGIHVWQLDTGKNIVHIQFTHDKNLLSAQLSADSKRLLTLSTHSHTVEEWSIATGALLHRYHSDSVLLNANYGRKGDHVVASSLESKSSVVWKAGAQAPMRTIDHSDEAELSADIFAEVINNKLVTITGKKIVTWSLGKKQGKQQLLDIATFFIESIDFTSDNQFAVVTQRDGKIFIWDMNNNKVIQELDIGRDFGQSFIFPKQNKVLVSTQESEHSNKGYVYDLVSGELMSSFSFDGKLIREVVFSPDEKSILYVVENREHLPESESLRYRQLDSGTVKELDRNNKIKSYAYGKNGQHAVFVSSFDPNNSHYKNEKGRSEVIVYNLDKGERQSKKQLLEHPRQLKVVPHDNSIVISFDTDEFHRYSESLTKKLSHLQYKNTEIRGYIRDFALLPQGEGVVFAYGNQVVSWQFDKTEVSYAKKHTLDQDFVIDIRLSKDNQYILTTANGFKKDTAVLWNTKDLSKISTYQLADEVAAKFSPNSDSIALLSPQKSSAGFPTPKIAYLFKKMLSDGTQSVNIKEYERQAIELLPINRKCLTSKERQAFFLPELTQQQRIARGCSEQLANKND